MNVSFQISEAEVISALKIHSQGSKKALIIMLLGLIALILIGIFTQYKALAFGAAIGGTLTYLLILYLVIPYNAKKQFKEYRALREEVAMELSDQGISFVSESGNSKLPWSDFHHWKYADGVYLLYVTSNIFHIVPANEVPDQNIMDNLLIEKIGKRKV